MEQKKWTRHEPNRFPIIDRHRYMSDDRFFSKLQAENRKKVLKQYPDLRVRIRETRTHQQGSKLKGRKVFIVYKRLVKN